MLVVNTDEEKKEILRRYRRLLRQAKPYLKDGDAKQIKKAFNTSMEAHQDMRRKSGEPYIYHPLAVAEICVNEIGLGTTSIICALLHDVVEDTDIELEDIEHDFGSKVARIIDGLTKISGVFEYGSSQQAENFRKMLLTLSDDVRVILIKLADRLHNMRTLDSMPKNKQLKIASETIYLYAPLAHRLGLYAIKSELEDLNLKFTQAEKYRQIATAISATKDARRKFIKKFIDPIQKELNKQGFDFVIKGRPKSIYSIWNKMQKKNIPFDEVYDLFAIRIILDVPLEEEKAACWKIYSVITDFYNPNPERLRDWISTPKSNGYESLHTTVMSPGGQWVEVQIRTKRMDEIAEKGYAAHWKYKDIPNSANRQSGLEDWIAKVREILEQAKSENNESAVEFVDDFRSNFFNEEVFVFTPKGELRTLPRGATALDFAFDIHTEIGAKCLGAKVNQKLVPINYILSNGDQVEILTSNKQRPNQDWLRFAVSSKAKSKIKEILKEERKIAATEGKEIIKRKLKQLKIAFNSENLEKLTSYFKVKTPLELYFQVGEGVIPATSIKKFKDELEQQSTTSKAKISDAKSFTRTVSKIKGESQDLLLIGDDMDILDYKLAKCCNPIPGDDVFGFVTVNEGIKIHRTNCPNAPELMANYGYRVVQAKWMPRKELAYLSGLKVIGTDRLGLINDITKVISAELKVNMRSLSIDTEGGIFEGNIMLYVHDRSHLDTLIKKLEKVNGVVKVTRFDSD
ncbi:bifunctional (p)ppGpp synthetase/guanosine-3',5'-bis(diphosphate) 3'-pyrophosphohydrolase [Porifericola rhodea]|uniref:RelA/SpoT family protein n=1 Tax=Porifericola rhodea TaxID=930972 RepID=UPI002665D989|nr:bifunctional (p)ppGpp synthetase/guanosine-3',5'-bis(diphosphate) 3'-pyrophosphohydrolase [Porifericola rhodea]WKN33971.1 bifunctional (p)ppGpp synthetase/guanosine-3',5'-bis(diphosphate) 3'-pyrophosphohydrolase [Porifericola rhodea]